MRTPSRPPGQSLLAALLLRAFQRVYAGETRGLSAGFTDLVPRETVSLSILLGLAVLIGIIPGPLLAMIQPASSCG